jgi:hypothetical protein
MHALTGRLTGQRERLLPLDNCWHFDTVNSRPRGMSSRLVSLQTECEPRLRTYHPAATLDHLCSGCFPASRNSWARNH